MLRVVEISPANLEQATKTLREAGLRVATKEAASASVQIETFRHHGMANPPGEIQHLQHELTDSALDKYGIQYKSISNGIIARGGTPNHRWINLRVAGTDFAIKVLAATEVELEEWIARVADSFGIPKELLMADRPEGWPFDSAFPF